MMEMPKVNQHHERIQRMAGTWVGEEKLLPSPWSPGGVRTGRYDYRVICDGFFVAGDYQQMEGNKTSYSGHAIFGVDPATQEVTWYWVDSMGFPPSSPARGRWEGDKLTLIRRDDKGQLHSRHAWAFFGGDQVRFTLETTEDDGRTWSTFMEATYKWTAPTT